MFRLIDRATIRSERYQPKCYRTTILKSLLISRTMKVCALLPAVDHADAEGCLIVA